VLPTDPDDRAAPLPIPLHRRAQAAKRPPASGPQDVLSGTPRRLARHPLEAAARGNTQSPGPRHRTVVGLDRPTSGKHRRRHAPSTKSRADSPVHDPRQLARLDQRASKTSSYTLTPAAAGRSRQVHLGHRTLGVFSDSQVPRDRSPPCVAEDRFLGRLRNQLVHQSDSCVLRAGRRLPASTRGAKWSGAALEQRAAAYSLRGATNGGRRGWFSGRTCCFKVRNRRITPTSRRAAYRLRMGRTSHGLCTGIRSCWT
jgi:hypothetical protein